MKTKRTAQNQKSRRAVIAVFAALLMVPLFGMVAFSVDFGYLQKTHASLQRAADAASLAAVRDLIPNPDGTQDLAAVRATVRQFVRDNITEVNNFVVLDSDIEIGRYDPNTVYTNFTILNDGIFDTVRVTLRRDSQANAPVPLFFARVIGVDNHDVTATATAALQKASVILPAGDVLPFSVRENIWDMQDPGSQWNVYGDGRITDDLGNLIPGNWGTVDIGDSNNSTADISGQIIQGLRQHDLDALYAEGRISSNTELDSTNAWLSQAETGMSTGIKDAVRQVHGQTRIIPIYDSVMGGGNNADFNVVKWGVVEVVGSNWAGAQNSSVTLRKVFTYNGSTLRAQPDLSNTDNLIDGAFTTPVLVE